MVPFTKEEEITAIRSLFRDFERASQTVTIHDGVFIWKFHDGVGWGTLDVMDTHSDRARPIWQAFHLFGGERISYCQVEGTISIVTYAGGAPKDRYVIMGLDGDALYLYALDELHRNLEWVAPRAFAWHDLKKALRTFFKS